MRGRFSSGVSDPNLTPSFASPSTIAAGAAVFSWVLVSAFHVTLVEPRTVFFQYLLSLGVFPAVAWLFLRWQRAFLRLD